MTIKTEITLPPLPDPRFRIDAGSGGSVGGYSADQMRAHARAAVEADRQGRMPSDEVTVVGMPEFDALLDHIYEYGTASEGVLARADRFARALLARYGSGQPASCDCSDKSQCWEPCGDLGHDAEHAKLSSGQPETGKTVLVENQAVTGQAAASAEPVTTLRHVLEHAQAWISAAPHGDNCHLDPGHALGQNCECGKEGILAHIESALESHAAPVALEADESDDYKEGYGCGWNEACTWHREHGFKPPVAAQPKVTDEMVTRFLGWRLPQDFMPDAGISFKPSPDPHSWPVGTNLLTDPQARAMLEYVLTGVKK